MASLVAAITSTATSAIAAATTSAAPVDHGTGGGEGECRLLGPFALLVQLALGGLALLSLVYKRWRERPQRPVKIWFFDVSKQVFGSVLVHMANIFMSMLTSGRFSMELEPLAAQTAARLLRRTDVPYVPNPCSFYLLNLAIDTTIGIPILIVLLRVTTGLIAYTPVGWTEGNERLQIFFVMMLFPLIMNAIQYYIIDSFIKKKDMGHERIPQEDVDDRDPFGDSFGDDSDDGSISDESNESVRMSRSTSFTGTQKKNSKNTREEYDPDLDGQTVVGSSKSQEERAKLLPTELVPHE
ncbi:hypothetical protein ONZ43_g2082 [Nemania bipapillata]|uniref:Uncharacterized protein n=1 Tax=Nemania bipapillata TaxID=110536 RepID=A0ACC2J1W8_9PEZI|nr:hypothetical protein ONZ43_g2082 [Nemania bipapillata]